jgi:hypothetical protein
MLKYPAAMDADKITANPHQNVRNDGGRTPAIVVRGPGGYPNIMMDAERNARSGI